MTNNYEDLDQPELGHEEQPPAPRGFVGNIADAWRTRPLFKLIALITVIGGVGAASLGLFSSSTKMSDTTKLPRPPELHEAPGGQASPYFVEQTKEAEQQRAQQAMANGGSALPTPIGQSANAEMGGQGGKNDPLNELRAETERLKQQIVQVQTQQQAPKPPPAPPAPFDDTLAQAMQRELQQVMESWKPTGVKEVSEPKEALGLTSSTASTAPLASQQANAAGTPSSQPITIVPGGTVSYGQLLTEANSDVPGPILAQILSGPLSGARAVGNFQTINEYNVLQFTLVNFKGKDYSINAIALDPDTTLGGMATEVDERYFTRVLLPSAAGFLQGLGSSLAQGSSSVVENGTTTIVQQSGHGIQQGMFQGLSQGAQTMGQFLQNQANNTKPLVRVAAGTPIGIFYVASVLDTSNMPQAPYGYPGYPPGYGYPVASGVAGAPGAPGGTLPPGYYPGYNGPMPPQQGPGYPGYPGAPGYPGYPGYPYGQNSSYPNANVPYPMTSTTSGTSGIPGVITTGH